jgi:ABC-type transport system substrate-binding protein
MYYQNLQEEALKEEKYQRWEDWSRTLYVGTTYGTNHPDIQVGYGGVDRGMIHLRSGKLLYPDIDEIGVFVPYLADSWEFKQNTAGEYYIEYKLKPGVKFHDGEEFTSEAVAYSWQREIDLAYREVAQETHHVWWHETSWKRLETPDPLTLWQFMPDEAPTYLPHPMAAMHLTQHGFIVGPESTEEYCKETDPAHLAVNQAGIGPFVLIMDRWRASCIGSL